MTRTLAGIETDAACRVAILIVAYNGTDVLPDCLASLEAANFSGIDANLFVLDNASSDETTGYVSKHFPNVRLTTVDRNLGFAEGNNELWRRATDQSATWDYVYLLNQDTIVEPDFLQASLRYLGQHPDAGAAQSLLLLHPETGLINTAGNRLHFLGFGLPSFYRQPLETAPPSGPINYPSGASVLIRAASIDSKDLFQPDLFMYLEDAELGWTLHLKGTPPHLCADSRVFHKYQFDSTLKSYFYLERNRWWLVATHYRWRTFALLIPALALMEAGQILFAFRKGLLGMKLAAVVSCLSPTFLKNTIRARSRIQKARMVSDRSIVAQWESRFESPHLKGFLVEKIANPVFGLYHRLLCVLVRW